LPHHLATNPELRLEPHSVRSASGPRAAVVIAAATALAYSNTLDATFHFDDVLAIVRNESLRHLASFWPPSGNRYLGYLSFALNYRVGGLDVLGYHVVNILIHVCNALLVTWLTAATLRTPALRRADAGPLVRAYLPLTAALLFAAHPLQTQAVTYVVQRFTSLATLWYLLSLALYAEARLSMGDERARTWRAAGLYAGSLLAAVAAMRTKEIGFTLPFVAAGYELLLFGSGRRTLLLLAPLGATALLVPLGLATGGDSLAEVLANPADFAAEAPAIPRSVYLLTQLRVLVAYLRLVVLPIGQNVDPDVPLSTSVFEPRVLLALALLATLATFGAALLLRGRSANRAPEILIACGIAWFFVTSSVESSIIPIRDVMFEHRTYLPMAGLAVALGTGLLWGVERVRLPGSHAVHAALAIVVIVGPLGAAAYARNAVWRDDITLWTDAVAKSPGKARAHNNLGAAYEAAGRPDEAAREYAIALRLRPVSMQVGSRAALRPDFASATIDLGSAYQALGRFSSAEREYREAIRLDPSRADVHSNLGLTYHAQGRMDDAFREYGEAIRLDPRLAAARSNLANAYLASGRMDDAIREFREAIRIEPAFPEAHNNLGVAYQTKGQLDDAVREFREAIRLAPRLPELHKNLASVLKARGQLDDAAREYAEAARLGAP